MTELIAYASRTGTRRNLAALRAAGWRILVSAAGSHRPEGFRYAIDNGAWTAFQAGSAIDLHLFVLCVIALGANADFVVLPDIVMGGGLSLALSLRWLAWCLAFCPRVLIAVQDGMVDSDVAELLNERVGIFIGGSTEWKLATMDRWAALARRRGAWCHVGRVNSQKRIWKCASAGATSFDGTSASRYAVTLPKLDAAVRQQTLDLETS